MEQSVRNEISALSVLYPLQHMASLMERREAQRRYINESKTIPPSEEVVRTRLNELPPELEEADWSDDIDGSKDDVVAAVRSLPS